MSSSFPSSATFDENYAFYDFLYSHRAYNGKPVSTGFISNFRKTYEGLRDYWWGGGLMLAYHPFIGWSAVAKFFAVLGNWKESNGFDTLHIVDPIAGKGSFIYILKIYSEMHGLGYTFSASDNFSTVEEKDYNSYKFGISVENKPAKDVCTGKNTVFLLPYPPLDSHIEKGAEDPGEIIAKYSSENGNLMILIGENSSSGCVGTGDFWAITDDMDVFAEDIYSDINRRELLHDCISFYGTAN